MRINTNQAWNGATGLLLCAALACGGAAESDGSAATAAGSGGLAIGPGANSGGSPIIAMSQPNASKSLATGAGTPPPSAAAGGGSVPSPGGPGVSGAPPSAAAGGAQPSTPGASGAAPGSGAPASPGSPGSPGAPASPGAAGAPPGAPGAAAGGATTPPAMRPWNTSGKTCLQAGSGKYGEPGPYKVGMMDVDLGMVESDQTTGKFTIFYPMPLEAECPHPIVAWGNGTGVNDSSTYAFFNNNAASWGLVVIASQDPNTGSGAFHKAGLDFLLKQNDDPMSMFYKKLSPRAGTSGPSRARVIRT